MILSLDMAQANVLPDKMKNLALHQLPSAYKKALNQTAKDIQASEVEEMKRSLDRPTPFTLRAPYVFYGRDYNDIRVREWAGKGTSAVKYLAPQVYGGDRSLKRFERSLQAKGILPIGMYAAPGPSAQLDAYGNMARGTIVKIMSYFQAFGEQGYRANITDKRRSAMKRGSRKIGAGAGLTYFAIRTNRGNLAPGIYARYQFAAGSALKCLILFVRKPNYEKRYRYMEHGEKVFYEKFPENLWLFGGENLGGKS